LSGLVNAKQNKRGKNCSIEEPIEFAIKNVRQIPVVRDDASGQGTSAFGLAIRSLLRLDPDVLMIGEIRDWETAELAASATESGHFVFSTIHTSSALGIIPRLCGTKLKLPIDQVTTKGFLAGLIFQKLIAKLCPSCKVPIDMDSLKESDSEYEVELHDRILKVFTPEEIKNLRVKGNDEECHVCGGKGNLGRTVCVETILPTNDILEAFTERNFIKAYASWRAQATDDPDNFEGKPALLHALRKAAKGEVSVIGIEDHFDLIDTIVEEDKLNA
jgi:general secretion pathway protein E